MTFAATLATNVNDWLSRGAERLATLVSPVSELEVRSLLEEGRPPVVTLTVTSGLHRGAAMTLCAGEYLVGSADDCDIVLRDRSVEPRHCRLLREWFGFSLHDLRGGKPQPIAPQTVNYDEGEIEALYDIGGVSLSLRQPPPPRRDTVSDSARAPRRSWVLPAAIAAGLVTTIVAFMVAHPAPRQTQPALAVRIVAANQALLAQGFDSVHFRQGPHGELEVAGLINDVAQRERLFEWLRRAHYTDAHVSAQPVSELLEQARHAVAAEDLKVALHAGQLRIEGTTAQMAVKDRIRTLTADLQGTVSVEDRVTYVDAHERNAPAPPFPIRLRGVMVGNPSYFLTDEGARYFVGGVLPDGAEVLSIEARQIRFAMAGKVVVYNLE